MTNQDKLRTLFADREQSGVAFCVRPGRTPIFELEHGDYTLSDRPVDEWVPWVVEDYARQVAHGEALGDDSVPVASLMTGTHIYAAAFGSMGMHCCADAEYQFESFRKIPNFYALNRVQAQHGYLPVLEQFAGPGSPTHVLDWIQDEDIAALLQQAPDGTRFVFARTIDDLDEARAWLEKMEATAAGRQTPQAHVGG